MNIDTIRKAVESHYNIKYLFIYNGSRGQLEQFYGKINRIYPRIFTIKTLDGTLKSFSYSDYAIKNIKIKVQ